MAHWKPVTREEMLTWFANRTDDQLAQAWCWSRDKILPETYEENFICRGCRWGIKGVGCTAPASMGVKSYKDCEAAVSENPISWLSRMRDPFEEDGFSAYNDGLPSDFCPYDDDTDGRVGWLRGWCRARDREQQGVFQRL